MLLPIWRYPYIFSQGEPTLYYVYAAFPLKTPCTRFLRGKHVIELFDNMASNRVEALSIKLVIEEGKVTTLFINGQLWMKETYNIATIDFLLGGETE